MSVKKIINKISNIVFAKYLEYTANIITPLMKQFLIMKGVVIGKGLKLYGYTKFFLIDGSHISIGSNCRFRSTSTSNLIGINHKCIIATHTSNASIIVGNNCGFSGTTLGAFEQIVIGNNVMCGANTLITDSDWHIADNRVSKPRKIQIGDNVWLGYNVIVLKGVTIGANTIIGAGSVVTVDIPPNVIAAGNPCKVLKSL